MRTAERILYVLERAIKHVPQHCVTTSKYFFKEGKSAGRTLKLAWPKAPCNSTAAIDCSIT